jgi:hypothetical protein
MVHQKVTPKFPTLVRAPARQGTRPLCRRRTHAPTRERRRQGLRCLTIELRKTEIDALVRMGFLRAEMRNDVNAVTNARVPSVTVSVPLRWFFAS